MSIYISYFCNEYRYHHFTESALIDATGNNFNTSYLHLALRTWLQLFVQSHRLVSSQRSIQGRFQGPWIIYCPPSRSKKQTIRHQPAKGRLESLHMCSSQIASAYRISNLLQLLAASQRHLIQHPDVPVQRKCIN